MGSLKKDLFSSFAEYDCERQLLLTIGKDDKRWLDPARSIDPLNRYRVNSQLAMELGKDFEQKVYKDLIQLPETVANTGPRGQVVQKYMNPQLLLELYQELKTEAHKILLEHEIPTPPSFLHEIIGSSGDLPITKPSEYVKPDIIILEKQTQGEDYYSILPNGETRPVVDSSKVIIGIIDIKVANAEKISKKQLIELVFYARAFAHYLVQHGLTDKFAIGLKRNGIFAKGVQSSLRSFEDLFDHIVPLNWNELRILFDKISSKIQELYVKAPQAIESSSVNIQSGCGRCPYLEDCKKTLDFEKPGKDWDIRLIPNMTRALAEQLRDAGVITVGQLESYLQNVVIGDTPDPLYPEIPLLNVKSTAIVQEKPITPPAGELHAVQIPKYVDIAITFNLERDPIHERAIGMSIFFDLAIFPTSKLFKLYEQFLQISVNLFSRAIDTEKAAKVLATFLDPQKVNDEPANLYKFKQFFKSFERIHKLANSNEDLFTITFPTESNHPLQLRFCKTVINEDLDPINELEFIEDSIPLLVDIQFLVEIMEIYFTEIIQLTDGKEIIIRPSSAVYFWSSEVLTAIEDLLERNMTGVLTNPQIKEGFLSVLTWFTPSDSRVKNPLQIKKVFDLKTFSETVLGAPTIINYTWHGIGKHLLGTMVSDQYWNPHFNYLDFKLWHDFLNASNTRERYQFYQELQKQLLHKVRTINNLRVELQKRAREITANMSQLSSSHQLQQYRRRSFPSNFHPIAISWYIFAKLTSSVDEFEALHYRTMYPLFSIGKLNAAEVTNLQESHSSYQHGKREVDRYRYSFEMHGLSTNMKLSQGNNVYLLPNEMRNVRLGYNTWKVNIANIEWDSSRNCYRVTTEQLHYSLFTEIRLEMQKLSIPSFKPQSTQWYLYPTSFDNWSRKLFRIGSDNCLYRRHPFAESWLGMRLAFLWDLLTNEPLPYPESTRVGLPEIYLFAPHLLAGFQSNRQQLLTKISPKPNKSQQEAILNSLNNVVSLIKGPPGTGKSQTIVALIDDFLVDFKQTYPDRPARVLITSFSYSALYVLVDMIREASYESGTPVVKQPDMVFIRSAGRSPVLNENISESDPEYVHDFARDGSKWTLNGHDRVIGIKQKFEDHFPSDVIVFANAYSLFNLRNPEKSKSKNVISPYKALYEGFNFDLILVDEASQVPTDQILSSLQYVHDQSVAFRFDDFHADGAEIHSREVAESVVLTEGSKHTLEESFLTKLVLIGDYNQLPPVQPVKPPKNLEIYLGSLFTYYAEDGHDVPAKQLKINYRSHQDIVDYTASLGFYEDLTAFVNNASRTISGNLPSGIPPMIADILDPQKVLSTVIHEQQNEVGVSVFEADLVVELIMTYFKMRNPVTREDHFEFWQSDVGVVAPHNAQGRLIIRKLYQELTIQNLSQLSGSELMDALAQTIYSVEKFQGSARNLIISTIGISSIDQLKAEEEFIYDANRFNVLTSRPRSKIVLVCSRNFLEYIPDDVEVMGYAEKIRRFAMNFCNQSAGLKWNNMGLEHRWYGPSVIS